MRLKHVATIVVFLSCLTQNFQAKPYQEKYRYHTIEQGETVYSIAKKHNVSVEEIYKLNPNTEKGIKINETLVIPSADATNGGSELYFLHSVQPKETLYSVSKYYGIPMEEILAANEGLTAQNFKIGYVVRIPKKPGIYKPVQATSKTHTVESKETLYSLSNKYNVSIEQISEANPEIKKKGLKKGMTLVIPTNGNANNAPKTFNSNETSLLYEMTSKTSTGLIRIGLLLPFHDINESQKARFIEYYEGFLLAVEDMKKKGYSIDLYTFDIRKGKNTKKLESLLDTYELKGLNMIIGGVSDEEIAILSKFTKENGIEYVVPFPVKNENVIKNPDTFLSNVSPALLYSKVSDIASTLFRDCNIIIVEEEKASENDKKDFVTDLSKQLSKKLIKSQTVFIGNTFNESLQNAMSASQKNVIVPASSSLVTLSKIIPAVRSAKNQNPTADISLFGYPDWQTYSVQFLEDFFKYDTYIFSSFYVDNNDWQTKQFMDKFQQWYGKPLLNTYPKYGLLGYDTGIYFLTALFKGSGKMSGNIPASQVPTIQSVFYFNDFGQIGNINTGLYFVHYKTDMTIEKIDYSK